MATLYAKSAGGNWNSAGTWSTTGSGGGDSSGPPTAADNCIAESGSGGLTIDSSVSCRSFDCTAGTGNYAGTMTFNSGGTWTIGDATAGTGNIAFKLASGMTLVWNSAVSTRFFSTSATQQTVDFAGKAFGSITFGTGTGGNYKMAAGQNFTNAQAGNGIQHNRGTLDLNDAIINYPSFTTTWVDTAPVLTLGTSQLTLTGSSGFGFGISDSGVATINQGTSSITLSGYAARFQVTSSYTFYDLSFTGPGKCTIEGGANQTFHNLTRTSTGGSVDRLQLAENVTVSNALTLTGNSRGNPLRVQSDSNTQRTITANGTISAQDVWFWNINGAGSASWNLSGQRVFDAGSNTGITTSAYALQETRFNNYQFMDAGDGMSVTEKSW